MEDTTPKPQISPEKFIWEKYISKNAVSTSEIFGPWINGMPTFRPEVAVVGFCPANRLAVRPRNSGYAVMVVLEDGLEVWCHYCD